MYGGRADVQVLSRMSIVDQIDTHLLGDTYLQEGKGEFDIIRERSSCSDTHTVRFIAR